MDCIEFNSQDLEFFSNIDPDRPASYKAAGHHSRWFCRMQQEHRVSTFSFNHTHCSSDKHLGQPHINKKKYMQTIFLTCLFCLLRNRSKQIVWVTERWGFSTWNKLMSYMQYIEQSRIKVKNNVYQLIYYCLYSALGPAWAETRVQSGDWYGSGMLHPRQVLRCSLPLLSPAF